MRIFLAGATGVIGSTILAKLIEDSEISLIFVLIHNAPLKTYSKKIVTVHCLSGINGLDLFEIDAVFNCVGEKINKDEMYSINVDFATMLLKRSIECGVGTYFYISSVGSYGASRYSRVISETSNSYPTNYYETTKHIAELKLSAESEAIRILILQPSNVLVTSNSSVKLLPQFNKILKLGIIPIINGKNGWLNYVSDEFVANVAREFLKDKSRSGKYILNQPIRYLDAANIVSDVLSCHPARISIPRLLSEFLFRFCNAMYKLTRMAIFDTVTRKIYEIDNDVCFVSQVQSEINLAGNFDAKKLFTTIAYRSSIG